MRVSILELERIIKTGCQVPGCKHKHHEELFLRPRCHPQSGVVASYKQGSGIVNIACKECREPVVEIAVSPIL